MAKELTAVNIRVLSSEKRVVSGFIIALCGAPTGIANVYEIAKDDLPRIPADPQGVKRFQPWVYEGPSIEVAKYDGSLQCEMGQPVSVDQMEKELRAAGIAVETKAKKADGIQHPRMCGASTGTMNVYRIKTSDLEKARALGFVLYIEGISIARDRAGESAPGTRVSSCPEPASVVFRAVRAADGTISASRLTLGVDGTRLPM